MGCKMIAAITWTQLELKGLLEDEESHVYLERAKRHLGLHPFHLTDLNAALREILNSTINSYDSKLEGIILSYKNPKLLSRMGAVLYDTCYIHIDIEADFYIFRPNVGDTLKGIVNKKSQDHVGILVHKTFNATIPRPDDDENWPGHSIHIGQEVRFTVTCLDFKDRLPYIRGSMDKQDYLRGCKTFDETRIVDAKPKKTKLLYADNGDLIESNASQEISVDNVDCLKEDDGIEGKASRKKSKKLKIENSEDGVRVKTKKKHKVEAEVEFSGNEVDSYDKSESHSGDVGNVEEEFLPGKLKLKREIIDDKIPTKKKKKKNNVKAEEEILLETEYKASQSYMNEVSVSDEEFVPRKSKKLKRENIVEKMSSKNNNKAKVEVDIIYSDIDFEEHGANGNKKIKNESSDERSRKKRKVKTEILSEEEDADVSKAKQSKRMKIESNEERGSKKYKVKAEIFSSETESGVNEAKQSVRTKRKSTDEKSKKKHRIKAEVLKSEVSD